VANVFEFIRKGLKADQVFEPSDFIDALKVQVKYLNALANEEEITKWLSFLKDPI